MCFSKKIKALIPLPIKATIKKEFFNLITWILCHHRKRDIILFESAPDLSDNTKAVYDEFVRRGLDKKYKLVWILANDINCPDETLDNIHYIKRSDEYKSFYYQYVSKIVICCNRFTGSNSKNQHVFYLMHGSPLKDTSGYYTISSYVTNVICQSPVFVEYIKKCYSNNGNIISLGFPRNNELFSNLDLSALFGGYSKYIIWYPTVKKFKNGFSTNCIKPIQFICDYSDAETINKVAQKNNVLIIVKPHFAQLNDQIVKHNLSNIIFINDDFFKKNNITSYQLVGSCDSLLTDYSSIYYDYLLCDKPIGMIWSDIEEYKTNPGLVSNYEKLCSGSEKLYSVSDLCNFIERVALNIDIKKEERNYMNTVVNPYEQESVTANIVDYIINTINNKEILQ